MAIKKPACPLPSVRAQTFARPGVPAATASASSAVQAPPQFSVVNRKAFWDKLPWDEINFFSREWWVDMPAVESFIQIDRFVIRKNMILVLTGIEFRARLNLGAPGLIPIPWALAGDDYLQHEAFWFVSLGGQQLMDRTFAYPAGGAPEFSGYSLLNRNVTPFNKDFAVFVKQDSAVECRCFVGANVIAFTELDALGVEWTGFWLPISAYDKLKSELR